VRPLKGDYPQQRADSRIRELWPVMFAKKGTPNAQTVRLVTIWLGGFLPTAIPSNHSGANDCVIPEEEPANKVSQAVPLDEFVENLRFFLDSLTSVDSPYAVAHEKGLNIVLITPPPLSHHMMRHLDWVNERHPDVTRKYVDAVLALGEEYKAKETEEGNWRIGTINMWDRVNEAASMRDADLNVSHPHYLR
jgi:hypothetical protein